MLTPAASRAVYANYLSIDALRWYFKDDHVRAKARRVLGPDAPIDWMPMAETLPLPEAILPISNARLVRSADGSGLDATFYGQGVAVGDYDNDGWLDLVVANDTVRNFVFHNRRDGRFEEVGAASGAPFVDVPPEKGGGDLFKPIVGRGSAYADIDGDGDLDVVMTQAGGAPLLLRNDLDLGHRWIRLKLTGTRSNRSAIGAQIQAVIAGRTLWREVMPTRGYLSQSEPVVTLALGAAETAESVTIRWPSGLTQTLTGLEPGRTLAVQEPSGP